MIRVGSPLVTAFADSADATMPLLKLRNLSMIGLLAISVASCTTGSREEPRPPLNDEGHRLAAVDSCYANASLELDDGHSDTATLAHAVRMRCGLDEMRAEMAMTEGDLNLDRTRSLNELEQRWEQEAMEAVVRERNSGAKSKWTLPGPS